MVKKKPAAQAKTAENETVKVETKAAGRKLQQQRKHLQKQKKNR